jgi:hypothetical protein
VPVEAKLTLRQTFQPSRPLPAASTAITSETRETAIAAIAPARPMPRASSVAKRRLKQGGEILVSARALDSAGRAATTHHSFWVAGRMTGVRSGQP